MSAQVGWRTFRRPRVHAQAVRHAVQPSTPTVLAQSTHTRSPTNDRPTPYKIRGARVRQNMEMDTPAAFDLGHDMYSSKDDR